MDIKSLNHVIRACNGRPSETRLSRFWSKVNKSSGCWNWVGFCGRQGYGIFYIGRRPFKAHRVSWTIHNGKIPHHDSANGMCVLHHCDNPSCVNPDHLFLGTNSDNVADMVKKDRQCTHIGTLNTCAKLTDIQVRVIRSRHPLIMQTELAKIFSVLPSTINNVVKRRTWKHI